MHPTRKCVKSMKNECDDGRSGMEATQADSEYLAEPRLAAKNGYLDSIVEYLIMMAARRPRPSPDPWTSSTSTCTS